MTLLELLVALGLATVVMAAGLAVWQSLSNRQQSLKAQIQAESEARIAMQMLQTHISRAGYVDITNPSTRQAVRSQPALTRMDAITTNLRHTLTVRHQTLNLDCLSIAPGTDFVEMQFYVQATSVTQLYCRSRILAGTPPGLQTHAQPLVRGVEELTFRFLVNASWKDHLLSTDTVAAVDACLVVASTEHEVPAQGVSLPSTRPTCARTVNGDFQSDIARSPQDRRAWTRLHGVIATPNLVYAAPAQLP